MEQKPHLLRLPGELRNRIYREALIQDEDINVTGHTTPREPAVLAVCKPIRKEALPIYYSENSFLLYMNDFKLPDQDLGWLQSIGPDRASRLTRLRLELDARPVTEGARTHAELQAWMRRTTRIPKHPFMIKYEEDVAEDLGLLRLLGVELNVIRVTAPESITTVAGGMKKQYQVAAGNILKDGTVPANPQLGPKPACECFLCTQTRPDPRPARKFLVGTSEYIYAFATIALY